MKILDKLGLAVFSLLTLVGSLLACLIAFGSIEVSIITSAFANVLSSQNGTYWTIGVSIVLILLAIKCLFFPGYERSKTDDEDDDSEGILLQNDSGKLLITKGTIQNIVSGVVDGFKEVVSAESKVEIDANNDVSVNLSLGIVKGTIIKDVSAKLQNNIKASVKKATDLEIKAINIKVNEVENEEHTEETKTEE